MSEVQKNRVVLSTSEHSGQSAQVVIETWQEEVENDGVASVEDRLELEIAYAGISPNIAFFPHSDAEWAHGDLVERKYPQSIISSRFDQITTDLAKEDFDEAIEAVSVEAAAIIAEHFGLTA